MSVDTEYNEIFTRPPKKAQLENHFSIAITDMMHQIDILYLPEDKGYRYTLCVVDVASRFKAARPLKTRMASEYIEQLMDIYENEMNPPIEINSDSEFAVLKTWCNKNKINLRINKPSNHCAFVENFNKELARLIFKDQHIVEMETHQSDTKWVNKLQKYVKALNNRKTRLIKMKPVDAYKMIMVPQPTNNFSKEDTSKRFKVGTLVRRMLNGDEILTIVTNKTSAEKGVDKTRRRATDPYFTRDVYRVSRVIEQPVNDVGVNDNHDSKLPMFEIQDASGTIYPHHYTHFQLRRTKFPLTTKAIEQPAVVVSSVPSVMPVAPVSVPKPRAVSTNTPQASDVRKSGRVRTPKKIISL